MDRRRMFARGMCGAGSWRGVFIPCPILAKPVMRLGRRMRGSMWDRRANWGLISVDTERGLLFIPIGQPAPQYYGGGRVGQNLFASAIVAVDANTGKLRWYFQITHHDLWDLDAEAAPGAGRRRSKRQENPGDRGRFESIADVFSEPRNG